MVYSWSATKLRFEVHYNTTLPDWLWVKGGEVNRKTGVNLEGGGLGDI